MQLIERIAIIVLDSVGIGALPDAGDYGDIGSDTLGNIARAVGGLDLPNLTRLGLGQLCTFCPGSGEPGTPLGAYGMMRELSAGKDTTTGHWEMVGIILDKPFPLYPDGFPPAVIKEFVRRTGLAVLGNKAASGTEIISELGDAHIRTGQPIVYTSGDSVFQIAAHEAVIPLDQLYRICQTARDILQGEHAVARVIARPFTGESGAFQRTVNRRDFSLKPPRPTLLDYAARAGYAVTGIGKIEDLFSGSGITTARHTHSNREGIDATIDCLSNPGRGIIFTNLVDFDMLYGHRNDVTGYARALQEFDRRLPEILTALQPGDLLVLTADHGCDPTTASTDHSREYVPLLIYGKMVLPGVNVGERSTFADLGATAAEMLGLPKLAHGVSFASQFVIREEKHEKHSGNQ